MHSTTSFEAIDISENQNSMSNAIQEGLYLSITCNTRNVHILYATYHDKEVAQRNGTEEADATMHHVTHVCIFIHASHWLNDHIIPCATHVNLVFNVSFTRNRLRDETVTSLLSDTG